MARFAASGDGATVLLLQRKHLRPCGGEGEASQARAPAGGPRSPDGSIPRGARGEGGEGSRGLEASREQGGPYGDSELRRRTSGERALRRISYEVRDCDGTVINKKIKGGERVTDVSIDVLLFRISQQYFHRAYQPAKRTRRDFSVAVTSLACRPVILFPPWIYIWYGVNVFKCFDATLSVAI